jgi:tripartite-type tricarboxylate transporter receptor subunit TctC
MKNIKKRSVFSGALIVSLILLLVNCVGFAKTQKNTAKEDKAWIPQKEITFIVPFDAGGTSDIPARILTKYMNKYSAKRINVVNLPGSSGRVGMEEAAKANPDGYTVVSIPTGWFMMYSLGLTKKTYTDYKPITIWADSYMAVVVNKKSPYNTYAKFIAGAKKNPGKLKMGGVAGTMPVLAEYTIMHKENVKFNMVDIDSASKAPELLSGRIDAYIDGFAAVEKYIKSGDFICLGIFSDQKMKGYENIPLMKELGMDDTDFLAQRYAMWAPKGTPKAAVEYLGNLVRQASKDPDCISDIAKLFYTVQYIPQADYLKFLKKVEADTKKAVKPIINAIKK